MIPEHCSFVSEGTKCPLPPEFIIEVEDETDNSKFMIGLTCSDHRAVLENRFRLLQKNNTIPSGKITLTNIRIIHTDCIKGTHEDEEEVKIKRLDM
ncbi:hypothetical protein [Candidatus Nitrosocosmicus arcticus]|uniref:Uncharacterized protein n=1 Tax=Candidatus Nitrosocosmicus arcticus TaxID=2035267 RepID=A0A557SVM8_9ARCH|nr:hypothetical protein [Candidatus Nitrosocosmicus arcticus]TVP40655.1 hypothetical protein NARC_60042 [Candidatus Nitrosocosmicus arcticus]